MIELQTPPEAVEKPALSLKDGVVLSYQNLGLWTGDIATDLPPAGEANIRWHGAPIPREIWDQAHGFFRHANKTWRSEAQLRLFYKSQTREWKAIAIPQRVATGMFSGELKDQQRDAAQDVLRARAFATVADYMPCGTIHSHCDMSAWQSSIDHKDEISQTGIHITFGRVSSDKLHVHGRISFRKLIYPVNWSDWFPGWPPELTARRDDFELASDKDAALEFPKEWLDHCFPYEAPKPVTVYYGGETRGTREYWDDEDKKWKQGKRPSPGHGFDYWTGETEPARKAGPDPAGELVAGLVEDARAETGSDGFAGWLEEQLSQAAGDFAGELIELEYELRAVCDELTEGYHGLTTGFRQVMDAGMPATLVKELLREYVYGAAEPAKEQEDFPWGDLD